MNIDELRREIDGIDDALLVLFERRMEIAKEIGQYKQKNGLPIQNSEREREILRRLSEKARPELAEYVNSLYSSLIEMSRDYQTTPPNSKQAISR